MSDKYVRDPNNPGAVINTDETALRGYKLRKAIAERERKEKEALRNDVDLLMVDISDIKAMLTTLIASKPA